MFDFDAYYYDHGEFDAKIEELKDTIRNNVKEEIKSEMERLREENKKLQGIKEHFEEVKASYEKKKSECDRITREAEYNAKRARLDELMEPARHSIYAVRPVTQYQEKCDACNRSRQVEIKLPSGRMIFDNCLRKKGKEVYHPEEYGIYRIRMPRYDNELIVEYVRNTDDEYQRVDEPKRIIDNDMEFSKIEEECSEKNLYGLYFATLEECQRYCDYLNKKNDTAGYDYTLDGTYIGNDREEER